MQSTIQRLFNTVQPEHFRTYWPQFQPVAYAIYNENDVLLVNHPRCNGQPYVQFARTEQFQACTCILLDDIPTAIVDMTLFDSFAELYAIVAHESFHVCQHVSGETRYPDEILGFNYEANAENIHLRIAERTALLQAVNARGTSERQQSIRAFIAIRERRAALFPDFLAYEQAIETFEGPAFYVEYRAICDVSSAAQHAHLLEKYTAPLIDHLQSNLHIRVSCYSAGFALCYLLDELAPSWKIDFFQATESVYTLLQQSVACTDTTPIELSSNAQEVALIVDEINRAKQAAFAAFYAQPGIKLMISGAITLGSFDPMNIVRFQEQALHKNFLNVALHGVTYSFDQPVCTTFKTHFRNIECMELFLKHMPTQHGDTLYIEPFGRIQATVVTATQNAVHISV